MNMQNVTTTYDGREPGSRPAMRAQRPSRENHAINTENRGQNKNDMSEPVSIENLNNVVESIKKELEVKQTRIAIQLDPNNKEPVVQFLDKQSGEVIRQIPPKEIMKIRNAFQQLARGLLMDTKV